ncbi:MAG: transglycosylase SLT domain-containing protein [Bacteroidetes bacterium]|nr:transglycosylase SLT domain-containing protein [Bacteroidota bacterium]
MKTLKKITGSTLPSILILVSTAFLLISLSTGSSEEKSNQISADSYMIRSTRIPEKLSFADESVPLADWNVLERLDKELSVNAYWQSNTLLMLKRTGRYFPQIEKVLKEEGVPDDFKYLALAESGLTNTVSSSGAKGIWQFMDGTADSYGLKVSTEIDERYDLVKSTRAACKYLKKAKSDLGTWTLAAAAYNRGLSGIKRDVSSQKVSNYYDLYLNTETSRYVFRILALKLISEHPHEYGFEINTKDFYKPVQVYEVKIDTTIFDLAEFALKNKTTYRDIKLLNPWIRDDHLTIRSGDSVIISLPEILSSSSQD